MKKLEFPDMECRVRWAAATLPILQFSNETDGTDIRIVMNKRDLHNIKREILEFIKFYEEDFTPENIDKSITRDDMDDYC
jgi:hypothetical protein